MTSARLILIGVGLALGGYGAVLVWENPPVIIMRIVVWALVGVVLHDAVFAPLCVALGFAGRRLISRKWWPPVAVAGFCSVVLVFLAIPVYGKPGMHLDNMTVLDRNYPLGLWISLAIGWACVPIYYLALAVRRRPSADPGTGPLRGHGTQKLPVRQDEVVEQESSGDVERQPPAE
jgi:hypothetical protein